MKKEILTNKFMVFGLIIALIILGGILANLNQKDINVYNTEQQNLNLLSVNSTITKEFEPDKVEITLSVETIDMVAENSQQENARITQNVVTALKTAGLTNKQISTTNYSIYEQFEWDGIIQKNKIIGYKTSNTIKVILTELTITGKIIDVAVNAGANKVSNISFGLSEQKQRQSNEIVLKEASEYAKIKAQNIANGLGITIGKINTVNESTYTSGPRYYNYASNDMIASSSEMYETPISASDISVSATVTVQFEI
ncbi:MAG: SIMPL domain-containing protein [Candidatus ainarchaeum sp.]|nr:SIMPL domain-containing protein [Candidatus ainarchaeum sp.]